MSTVLSPQIRKLAPPSRISVIALMYATSSPPGLRNNFGNIDRRSEGNKTRDQRLRLEPLVR
jgi:hypothetical protein